MIGATALRAVPNEANGSNRTSRSTRPNRSSGFPLDAWSASMLRALLVANGAPAGGDDATMLGSARLPSHKLGATLLSLLEKEGRLSDAQSTELHGYRLRAAFYDVLWERLRTAVPGMVIVKGSDIARLYPSGALRAAADLDLHCTRRQLWKAGAFLVDEGWRLASLSLARSVRGVEVYVIFKKQSEGADSHLYEVELKTLEFVAGLDNLSRFAPMSSSIVRNVTALLAERREQRFRSRDLLDLALLLHLAGDDELASLPPRLDTAQLWPAWWEARRKLVRVGWCPTSVARLAPTPRGVAMRLPGARLIEPLRGWMHPLRAATTLLRRTADGDYGSWADRMSAIFHEQGGAKRALAAGMTLYGVGLDGDRADDLDIFPRGPHVVAATPLGSFLMVCGAAREEWLTQARWVG